MIKKEAVVIFILIILTIAIALYLYSGPELSPGVNSFGTWYSGFAVYLSSYNINGLTEEFDESSVGPEFDPNAEPYIPYNPYNPFYPDPLDDEEIQQYIDAVCAECYYSDNLCILLAENADCIFNTDLHRVSYDLAACMTYEDSNGDITCSPTGISPICRKIQKRHLREINKLRACLGLGSINTGEHWSYLLEWCRKIRNFASDPELATYTC